jgi:hypothetical protein
VSTPTVTKLQVQTDDGLDIGATGQFTIGIVGTEVRAINNANGYDTVFYNKVSSVNSQLTNTEQIVRTEDHGGWSFTTLPSPAEDGSYGTNGDAVFGFTPEDIYIEHNMHYIVATVPLHFTQPVNKLAIVDVATQEQLKALMARLDAVK